MIRTIARVENVRNIATSLLLVAPDGLDDSEPAGLLSWLSRGRPVKSIIRIGTPSEALTKQAVALIRDYPNFGKMQCAVITASGPERRDAIEELSEVLHVYKPLAANMPLVLDVDKRSGMWFPVTRREPVSFLDRVPYQPVHREFIKNAAAAISCFGSLGVRTDRGRSIAIEDSDGGRCVVILNAEATYLWCRVAVDKKIAKCIVVTAPFPRRPTMVDNSTFDIKVAPNGIAVVGLELH